MKMISLPSVQWRRSGKSLKCPGTMRVLVEGLHRRNQGLYLPAEPYIKVAIAEYHDDVNQKDPKVEALMRTLIAQFEQYVRMSKKIPPETVVSVVAI